MLPCSTTNNTIKRGGFDVEFTHQLANLPILASVAASYFSDLIIRQFGFMVLSSYRATTASAISVLGVLKFCAQNKMRRIYTRWNVTGMANDQVGTGKRAIGKFIRESMRSWQSATKANPSITKLVTVAYPEPTFVRIGFANISPKSLKPSRLAINEIVNHRSWSVWACQHPTSCTSGDIIVTQENGL